jgi:hypothetical protein
VVKQHPDNQSPVLVDCARLSYQVYNLLPTVLIPEVLHTSVLGCWPLPQVLSTIKAGQTANSMALSYMDKVSVGSETIMLLLQQALLVAWEDVLGTRAGVPKVSHAMMPPDLS